jgi:hypothetical protein
MLGFDCCVRSGEEARGALRFIGEERRALIGARVGAADR